MELRKSRGRQLVSHRTTAAALALTCLAFTANTYAFKQSIHEEITEEELSTLGFDELSCDEVGDSSYWTDLTEMGNKAAHVDDNLLDAGSERLKNKSGEVVGALKSCKRRDALAALGAALHTVQDIFAHSNAVDNGHKVELLKMKNGGAFTCDAANNFAPEGLVSGYFSSGGFVLGNQCMGMQPGQCCHRELNKDDSSVPNGARFPQAAQAARAMSRDYVQMVIDELHAKVGGDQAIQLEKMLKERQRTMMFVIDDTGSMYTDIAGVRSAALSFVDGLIAGGEAPTLGLVSFKDSANDRGEFCDVNQFRSAISSLYASGGGDCPEASRRCSRRSASSRLSAPTCRCGAVASSLPPTHRQATPPSGLWWRRRRRSRASVSTRFSRATAMRKNRRPSRLPVPLRSCRPTTATALSAPCAP